MVWTRYGLVGKFPAWIVEKLHQPFEVLHRGGEDGLLFHFDKAPEAGSAQSMGLLGFAEEVFDAVTQFARKFVAFGVGQFGGAIESHGLGQFFLRVCGADQC